jgi:prepilin-type N-terminal cleavage/methylation domain-containing protein
MLSARLASKAREDDGFTLVELLVAMAAASVVLISLILILVSTSDQAQLTTTRIAATRETRAALSTIENELHSACVGTGTTQNLAPVEPGSDGSSLRFVSYTGPSINPTPTWHVLSYNGTNGTLTDSSYSVTGTNGLWTPASQPTSTTTLLAEVSTQAGTPMFQYFAYQAYPIANSTNDYWTIPDGTDALPNGTTPTAAPEQVPLTSGSDGSAGATVEVLITLVGQADTAYAGQAGLSATADPETDGISLRLSDPPDEAPATSGGSYGPCE